MRILFTLCVISSYAYAILTPFIYIPEPLSYDDAELYCQTNYGTDLATMITVEDRMNVIDIVEGDANMVWTGLRNTNPAGWWEFIEPDIECPHPHTGACIDFWKKNGKPRCPCPVDAFYCTVFYLQQDLMDNNIPCNAKKPFLCNQQYNYQFGSEIPIPGQNITIDDSHGSGYFTLSEDVVYLHQAHTLQCVIEYDEEADVLKLNEESFIEITSEMYESANIDTNSILLVIAPIFPLLPDSCTREVALKVISIDVADSVKLYVQKAALFDYIPEMDLEGHNYTLFDNGEEAPLTIPDPNEFFAANNISNGSLTINELACAVYDQDGFLIDTEEPVDGKCNGVTAIEDYSGLYGDGFNSNTNTRRRMWGFIKKAVSWTKKKVTKIAKKTFGFFKKAFKSPFTSIFNKIKTLISIVTGNVNERIWESGINFDEHVQYELHGKKKIYSEGPEGNKKTVSVDGKFSLQTGMTLKFVVYADLSAKYKLFSTKPSFNYFKFEIGATHEFDTYLNFDIQGALILDYQLGEKKKTKIFMLGVIPVDLLLKAVVSIGVKATVDLKFSKSFGYDPLYIKFGVEYKKGSGWNKISSSNFQLTPRKKFGGEITDSTTCFKMTVAPYFKIKMGITFYEVLTVALQTVLSVPVSLSWPDTCDSMAVCSHSSPQLKFGISFKIGFDIVFEIGVKRFGFDLFLKVWPIWSHSWPLAAVCTDLDIPLLTEICCGSLVPDSSTTTTTTTTTTTLPTTVDYFRICTKAGESTTATIYVKLEYFIYTGYTSSAKQQTAWSQLFDNGAFDSTAGGCTDFYNFESLVPTDPNQHIMYNELIFDSCSSDGLAIESVSFFDHFRDWNDGGKWKREYRTLLTFKMLTWVWDDCEVNEEYFWIRIGNANQRDCSRLRLNFYFDDYGVLYGADSTSAGDCSNGHSAHAQPVIEDIQLHVRQYHATENLSSFNKKYLSILICILLVLSIMTHIICGCTSVKNWFKPAQKYKKFVQVSVKDDDEDEQEIIIQN